MEEANRCRLFGIKCPSSDRKDFYGPYTKEQAETELQKRKKNYAMADKEDQVELFEISNPCFTNAKVIEDFEKIQSFLKANDNSKSVFFIRIPGEYDRFHGPFLTKRDAFETIAKDPYFFTVKRCDTLTIHTMYFKISKDSKKRAQSPEPEEGSQNNKKCKQ